MNKENDIDWSFSDNKKPSWTGDYHAGITFNKKVKIFELRFNNGTPSEILESNGLTFGLKDKEVYVTTRKIDHAPYFKPRTHKNGHLILSRKRLVTDIVNQLLEKEPGEKASLQFNFKHCSDDIWRIVDIKLI